MPSVALGPMRIYEILAAFQRTAALRAAVELDLFTFVAEGDDTAATLARRCFAAERGVRILCDHLTMLGLLEKAGVRYSLARDSAMFLDRHSPAYLGAAAVEAWAGEPLVAAFAKLTDAVRQGGTVVAGGGTLAPEHPVWVEFARANAVPGRYLAGLVADALGGQDDRPIKVLDIAAGHGWYGVAIAQRNPHAEIYAVDWPQVLALAGANAEAAGVDARFHAIPGDALSVDLGTNYDLALVTNFLPDLDFAACHILLRRLRAALVENGRAAVFEMVLNDDRISPPAAVALNLALLATTPGGEARTPAELEEIFRKAGFARTQWHNLPQIPLRLVIGYR